MSLSHMPIEQHLRQLRLGLEEFRAGRLPLHVLVDHLESHLLAMKKEADEFTRSFSDVWLELETANALSLSSTDKPRYFSDGLNQIITRLETLIASVSDSERA